METEFKLTGLSAGNRCTLLVDDTDKDWFHAPTNLPEDRFQALFDYFKKSNTSSWTGNEKAIVKHNGFDDEGHPIDPIVIEVKL